MQSISSPLKSVHHKENEYIFGHASTADITPQDTALFGLINSLGYIHLK